MSNYINYLKHVINAPKDIYRHFAYDIILDDENKDTVNEKIKHVAINILPLVSLYRPLGQTLSISMSAVRIVFNTSQMFSSIGEDKTSFCLSVMQVTLSVAALAGTVFHYKFCILLTNLADVLQNTAELGSDIKEWKTENLAKDILHLASSISYMATFYYGDLEIILLSYLIQIILNAYLANQDIKNKDYISFASKIAMGLVRGFQAIQTYKSIKRRNDLLNNDFLREIFSKIKLSKETFHLLNHQLGGELENTIENDNVEFEGIDGEKYSAGSHYHGFGKGLVKGMNVALKITRVQGQTLIELDFKISHVHRDRLEKLIEQMKNIPEKNLQELFSFTNSKAKSVILDTDLFDDDDFWFFKDLFSEHRIFVEGLGSIIIGTNRDNIGSYDHVIVRIDHKKNLFDLYELLSFFNLEEALMESVSDDITRLKLGHLYHTLFPRESYILERDEKYFNLQVNQLKQEMIARAPKSKEMFDRYLDNMELVDIIPGRKRYAIPDLGREVYDLGGRALVSTLMTSWCDDDEKSSIQRVGSILKMGFLSYETKKQFGISNYKGLNNVLSEIIGGSDGVFTQLITKSVIENNMSINDLMYSWFGEEIVFLIDLEAIETGTYQYHDDYFGNRMPNDDFWWDTPYSKRDSIFEFTQKEERDFNENNEVIIKERIAPEMIKGIVVAEERIKKQIIEYLIQQDIISNGKIFGIEINKFIHVSDHFSKELVSV